MDLSNWHNSKFNLDLIFLKKFKKIYKKIHINLN